MKNIDDQSFEHEVYRSKKIVLVEFCTVWNGACHINAQVLKRMSEKFKDQIKVCTLDVENNQVTPGTFGIGQIPTVVIFKDGQMVDYLEGLFPVSTLEKKISDAINSQKK